MRLQTSAVCARSWQLTGKRADAEWSSESTRETSLCEVVNADFYIVQTGCQWRLLPQNFPPDITVQRYLYAWRDSSAWQTINHVLLMEVREAAIRNLAVGPVLNRPRLPSETP